MRAFRRVSGGVFSLLRLLRGRGRGNLFIGSGAGEMCRLRFVQRLAGFLATIRIRDGAGENVLCGDLINPLQLAIASMVDRTSSITFAAMQPASTASTSATRSAAYTMLLLQAEATAASVLNAVSLRSIARAISSLCKRFSLNVLCALNALMLLSA